MVCGSSLHIAADLIDEYRGLPFYSHHSIPVSLLLTEIFEPDYPLSVALF
jgi:hypothetical protein